MADATPARGERPSICFVTTDFVGVIRNGGIGTHFWLMSRLLAKRGWDVHVLFCGEVDDEQAMAAMPGRMATEGINFMWLRDLHEPSWIGIQSHVDGMDGLYLSQWAMEALEALHAEHHFDMIEFPDWRALGFRSVQAKHLRLAFDDVALAVKLHSTSEWQRHGNFTHRTSPWELKMEWCERYAFERADIQLSPSRYMVDYTRAAEWKVRDEHLVAYPFPDPEDDERPVDQAAGLRKIAFFGRLEQRKGLDVFLDAIDEVPTEHQIVFLGRDSKFEGRSAKEVIGERLADRPYVIEDELDREGALAKLADGETLAVIPSYSETFGFTVAECVANRIPFIAAQAGGIPEVVRHQEARERWLFEPTTAGLAEALSRRLASEEEFELALRLEAAEACHHERWNDEVEFIYRDAVERFRAGGLARRQPPDRVSERPRPTVSVAVTHYNHGKYLPAALASIAAQTRAPDEVLVIDDGSTGAHDREVFEEMEARYPAWRFLRQRNGGPGSARNRCLELAGGSHFLPFDSDNIARPEMIETMVTALGAEPSPDVVTCGNLAFVEDREIETETYAFRFAPTGGPRILAPLENLFGDTCALFRAEALREVGGFEVDPLSPHEDWETMSKIVFAGFKLEAVPRPLFWYRTEVGGRLEALTEGPAEIFRLRRRLVEDVLSSFALEPSERIALWECLIGFAEPDEIVPWMQEQQEELLAWAQRTLADCEAWHVNNKDEIVAWHEADKAETVAWYEDRLAEAGPHTLETTKVKDLWSVTTRRTIRAIGLRAAAALRGRRSASA